MTAQPVYNRDYQALIEGLKQFQTRSALYHSSFYKNNRAQLEAILNHIWYQPAAAAAPARSFLRVVQWNIERGRHLNAIVALFNEHPLLKGADIITLNEVDVGMTRTGNLNIAFELGARLNMHACFVAEYIEMTKGIRAEASLPGENREALHGNAILSRWPLKNIRAVRLPCCFDTYLFAEKRYGERVAIVAEIDCPRPLLIATTHLEVRRTPACRARQLRALLAALDANTPAIIGGDFNTGTFKRGHIGHTAMALARLLFNEPASLRQVLRNPAKYEPLFSEAARAGFSFAPYNDDLPTCITPLKHLDEADYFPFFIQRWLNARLARYGGQLEFRLDFILARAITALADNELQDDTRRSHSPVTLPGLTANGEPISDHDAISCDFAWNCEK